MINWWRSRTLRFRLAVWYALGGVVLLTGFATTLYVYVSARMAAPLDDQHRADLAVIQQRMRVDAQNRVLWDGVPVDLRAEWTTNDPWFELWDEQGNLVGRFWPFAENRVALKPSPPARGRETISIFSVAPDIRLRALSVPYEVPGRAEQWMVRIMRIHQPAADALGAMRLIIFVTVPIIVALLVIGGYTITRRWLMPLDRMVAEANRITADDLSRRLPVANPHEELGRLAGVFNVTLDRLQASFDALDRFVADASHELRTPLTTLRSVGEVGLRRGRTVEEYREIIGSMLEEAQRLQLLIERLLELASAEGGDPIPLFQAEFEQFAGDAIARFVERAVAPRAVFERERHRFGRAARAAADDVSDRAPHSFLCSEVSGGRSRKDEEPAILSEASSSRQPSTSST